MEYSQGFFGIPGRKRSFWLTGCGPRGLCQGLIDDGEIWMEMIRHRNLSTHTYNEETMKEIAAAILSDYVAEFGKLVARLKPLEIEVLGE